MQNRASQRWRIDHQIPLAIILTIVLQTGAGVWFIANLAAKVDRALEVLAEFKSERYTKHDAQKDREFMMQILQTQQVRDTDLSARIDQLERRYHPATGGGLAPR